jgi:SlyX protein
MSSSETGSGNQQGHAQDAGEARLTELEIKLSYTEDLLEELNRTAFRQQQQIDELQRHIKALREQMQASMPSEQRNLSDEVPPHY